MRTMLIAAVLTLALATGCSHPCRECAAPDRGSETPIVPTTPAQQEPPQESPVQITYTRTGGFAGRHEVLHVHADGRLEFTVRGRSEDRALQVEPASLATLMALVQSPEFEALEGPFEARGSDLITYTIEVRWPEGAKRVVTMDAARPPEIVAKLIRELDDLRGAVIERGTRTETPGGAG